MSGNVTVCDVAEDVKEKIKKFRTRKDKNPAAYILKVDADNLKIVEEAYLEDVTVDELRDEIPEHMPRFIVYSYVKHLPDNRVQYPLALIFFSPSGTKPDLQMMYAGSRLRLVEELELTKVYEIRDLEDFTEEWLMSRKF